jgi:hypothetical protein
MSVSNRKLAFKLGFLSKMAKYGVQPSEFFEKAADISPSSILSGLYGVGAGGAKALGGAALPLAKLMATLGVAAPLAGGVITGTAAAKLNAPPAPDIGAIRKEETIALYRRLAREIRARRRMTGA